MKRLWSSSLQSSWFVRHIGWVGTEIFRQAPPIPREIVTTEGKILISDGEVSDGQNVWQAMGGMQSARFGGTAVTSHQIGRLITCIAKLRSFSTNGRARKPIKPTPRFLLRNKPSCANACKTSCVKTPTKRASGRIVIDPLRARAFENNLKHYTDVFSNGNSAYAIQRGAQSDPVKLKQLTAFLFLDIMGCVHQSPEPNDLLYKQLPVRAADLEYADE